MTPAEEEEQNIQVGIAAAEVELQRQSDQDGSSLYFRQSDHMIDGRVNLHELVTAIMRALP